MPGTTRTKKGPTPRRPSVPAAPVVDFEDDGPVRIATSTETIETRVPLFYIDDVEYTMLDPVPARLSMAFLHDLKMTYFEVALARLVDRVMGDEAVEALSKCKEMTSEDLEKIIGRVQAHALKPTKVLRGK